MTSYQAKIPSAGPAREILRETGQFWTPDWIAQAMVAYALASGSDRLFDPAVGEGAFFRAAQSFTKETGRALNLSGTEIDPNTLEKARQGGVLQEHLARVQVTDFVLHPPKGPFKAIVANPPYIRHHRLAENTKRELQDFGASLTGITLDGRAGLHNYFLLRALQLLKRDGRLAFILPADTCEGKSADALWNWIAHRYRLEAVVTFAPEASPFPDVDTNPIIFMIRNARPKPRFWWAKCCVAQTNALTRWIASGFRATFDRTLLIYDRRLEEALATGLSRPPVEKAPDGPELGQFASILRGIATGANEFFFLTLQQARSLRIPEEFLVRAIGRTRDVTGDEVSLERMDALAAEGRPTLLFSPDGRPLEDFPPPVCDYLRQGEAMGLPGRPLLATRHPWYKMETRPVPPFLFAYLGRRNARFIRNLAEVVPLTCLLCVYPRRQGPEFLDRLWQVLRHPETIANLSLVGKSYGSGAIKVEPRALERLPLPSHVMARVGLQLPTGTQRDNRASLCCKQLGLF